MVQVNSSWVTVKAKGERVLSDIVFPRCII